MQLQISAIGTKPNAAQSSLIDEYVKRANGLGRNIGFSGPTVKTFEAPRSLTGDLRQKKESAFLLDTVPNGAKIMVLDERGKNISSENFAKLLGQWRDDGIHGAAFLIGGADGHHPSVAEKASTRLSFGALTWPHMLVRVMLTEQIYRAMTILSGHPYHRS